MDVVLAAQQVLLISACSHSLGRFTVGKPRGELHDRHKS
ncbi:MAG: hypothetical protein AVDCRST_MAG86-4096 [uncultured Truepera sp.]|uniref:Uncharacterized protein n=1 Tax=uncultured Truepera sp. TaxID=543023 RepID=A0A6J4VYQ1_9DEIN|nr:MAG: hypothetical protein AVDCRST_MAG86-4096 [uncultured Truepera sp.]